MLKKMDNLTVIDENGRKVRIQFRLDYIAYKERDYATYIGIDCRSEGKICKSPEGKIKITVDANKHFHDWLFPPHKGETLTLKDKVRIINFLEEAMKLLDYEFEVKNKPTAKILNLY